MKASLINYSYSWTKATVTNKFGRNIVFLKTQKVRKTKRALTEFNILPSSDCWQLSAKYTFQIRREEQSEYRGAEDRPHPLRWPLGPGGGGAQRLLQHLLSPHQVSASLHNRDDGIVCHIRFDYAKLSRLMGERPRTVYLTIMRDPVDIFVSAWHYYKLGGSYKLTLGTLPRCHV